MDERQRYELYAALERVLDPIGWRSTEVGASGALAAHEVAPISGGRNHGGQ